MCGGAAVRFSFGRTHMLDTFWPNLTHACAACMYSHAADAARIANMYIQPWEGVHLICAASALHWIRLAWYNICRSRNGFSHIRPAATNNARRVFIYYTRAFCRTLPLSGDMYKAYGSSCVLGFGVGHSKLRILCDGARAREAKWWSARRHIVWKINCMYIRWWIPRRQWSRASCDCVWWL